MPSYSHFLPFAHLLADAAGGIARRYFRTDLQVDTKEDNSPVSIADREIEQALRMAIHAQFSAHGILGEEFANDGLGRDWVWVIDPIDGTRAFLRGEDTFTTLIALCYQGTPVLGIIDQPIRAERYSGCAGQKSLLNGQIIKTNDCNSIQKSRIASTGPEYFTPEKKLRFDALVAQCGSLTWGGDAYNYARLAAGHVDLVIESGLKPFDVMPHRPIIEGAGGVLTTWGGAPLSLHNYADVVAAASPVLHLEAIKLMG